MPSDERIAEALAALRKPREAFRSAVSASDEEVRAYRLTRSGRVDPARSLERELGEFARGRIDAERLGALLAVAEAPDPLADRLMDVAHAVFQEVVGADERAFVIRVPPGGDLRDAVRDALASLGRAFGVAHAVERARSRRYDPDHDHALLHAYPFHRWSARERRLAPPLVVHVEGGDLRAAALSEFLDGGVKLVLVVEGKVAPAPLARLVAPEAFVGQAVDVGAASALAGYEGPGVVALTEPGAGGVAFVHDPAGGARSWERLQVADDRTSLLALADELDRRGRVPGAAADLRHLLELAAPPAGDRPSGDGAGPEDADPADRLAAWLLARTDLAGL